MDDSEEKKFIRLMISAMDAARSRDMAKERGNFGYALSWNDYFLECRDEAMKINPEFFKNFTRLFWPDGLEEGYE